MEFERLLTGSRVAEDAAEGRREAAERAAAEAVGARDVALAESRVFRQEVLSLRDEYAGFKRLEEELRETIRALTARVAALEGEVEGAQGGRREAVEELRAQLAINHQLMKAKEDTEWRLLRALATEKREGGGADPEALQLPEPLVSSKPGERGTPARSSLNDVSAVLRGSVTNMVAREAETDTNVGERAKAWA